MKIYESMSDKKIASFCFVISVILIFLFFYSLGLDLILFGKHDNGIIAKIESHYTGKGPGKESYLINLNNGLITETGYLSPYSFKTGDEVSVVYSNPDRILLKKLDQNKISYFLNQEIVSPFIFLAISVLTFLVGLKFLGKWKGFAAIKK